MRAESPDRAGCRLRGQSGPANYQIDPVDWDLVQLFSVVGVVSGGWRR